MKPGRPPRTGQAHMAVRVMAQMLPAVAARPRRRGCNDPPRDAGHGTFAADIARCVAPEADVITADDIRARARSWRRTSSVSSQCARPGSSRRNRPARWHAYPERPGDAEQTLWEERLRDQTSTVVVAAAGDDGARGAPWPTRRPNAVPGPRPGRSGLCWPESPPTARCRLR